MSPFRSSPSPSLRRPLSRPLSRPLPLLAFLATLALAVGLASPRAARACFMYAPQPMVVWLDHIRVDIKDDVAVKFYDCTFKNPNPQAVVGGECYMELEPGAQVDQMEVDVDGQKTQAEILDLKKSNEVFQGIVAKGGSPALLEYYGNQLIRTKVPQVKANGVVKVRLRYTMVLPKRGNLVRLQMLNTNPKMQLAPLQSASVEVNITSKRPIKNIYSPTHELKIVEAPGVDVSVRWKQENYLPKHPFVLYYGVADDAVGAALIAHVEEGNRPGQGHFMLMLSPTFGGGAGKVSQDQVLPKDVVFCVDTSGSMLQSGKMEQARAALLQCIERLRPRDRFNIVDFSTEARSFKPALVTADPAHIEEARRYAQKLTARGGTAIEEALALSLKQLQEEGKRPRMILFATDGLPTIGQQDPDALLRGVAQQNTRGVRLFVFGEGFDVNARLLDFLAMQNRGESDYVLPSEKIEDKIGPFFDRVGSPMLTDLEVEFDRALGVEDTLPRRLPDLVLGEQVVVMGRFSVGGQHKVRLSGYALGVKHTFEYTLDFPVHSSDDRHAFVPRLWAGQRIDFLLSEMRRAAKDSPELVQEVTRLAKQYGIVTPYTSFLMTDDIVGSPTKPGMTGAVTSSLRQLRAKEAAADRDDLARKDAVAAAWAQNEAKKGYAANGAGAKLYDQAERLQSGQANPDAPNAQAATPAIAQLHYVGARTFYNRQNVWYDAGYDPEQHEKAIQNLKFTSKEFIELLDRNPRAAKYMVFDDCIVQIGTQWYRLRKG